MILAIGNKNFSSWSLRPWVLMKHFGLSFEEVLIPLDMPETSAQIARHSPSGRIPALHDGSCDVWESLAIMEYLAEKNPGRGFWPVNERARAFARSVSNEMHSGFATLRQTCPMKVKERFKDFNWSPAHADVKRVLQIWRECRREFGAGGPFLFGSFTIADAMYAPVVFRFRTYDIPVGEDLNSYMEAMLTHPAMKEWDQAAQKEKLDMARYQAKV